MKICLFLTSIFALTVNVPLFLKSKYSNNVIDSTLTLMPMDSNDLSQRWFLRHGILENLVSGARLDVFDEELVVNSLGGVWKREGDKLMCNGMYLQVDELDVLPGGVASVGEAQEGELQDWYLVAVENKNTKIKVTYDEELSNVDDQADEDDIVEPEDPQKVAESHTTCNHSQVECNQEKEECCRATKSFGNTRSILIGVSIGISAFFILVIVLIFSRRKKEYISISASE